FLKYIATGLLRDWKPPPREEEPKWRVKDWAINQTGKAICKKVHAQWTRLLGLVDPKVVNVQRAMFAATQKCSPLADMPAFYEKPYAARDICNYRAAAIAAVYADDLICYDAEFTATTCPEYKALKQVLDAKGIEFAIAVHHRDHKIPTWDDCLIPTWDDCLR